MAFSLRGFVLGIVVAALVPDAGRATSGGGGDDQGQSKKERSFGGPEGVTRRIEEDSEVQYAFPGLKAWAGPYFDFKQRMKDEHGLTFGFTVHGLGNWASDTLSGVDDGFGGILRFQGSWNAVGRGTGNPRVPRMAGGEPLRLGEQPVAGPAGHEHRRGRAQPGLRLQRRLRDGPLRAQLGAGLQRPHARCRHRAPLLRRLPGRVPVPDLLARLPQPRLPAEPDRGDDRDRSARRRREGFRQRATSGSAARPTTPTRSAASSA